MISTGNAVEAVNSIVRKSPFVEEIAGFVVKLNSISVREESEFVKEVAVNALQSDPLDGLR